ncbi:MAG TPA: efflux RND transporter periplasmic adaptor subunit [Pirellulaceae bacterium]|jgi:RND family efflux transporter MFP subunit
MRQFAICQAGAAAAVAAIALIAGCEQAEIKAPPKKPAEVFVATPTTEVVTDYQEFTGRTTAVYTVEVRSRVSGYLDRVLFHDGADVQGGQQLAVIDDRIYQATAANAAAMVNQATARRDNLTNQDRRSHELRRTNAVSQEQYETIAFQRAEADAAVTAAEAQKQLADLNVSYTRVIAPISGVISNRRVDPGNLVKADDTVLATIVSQDPIYVYFDVNERTVLKLRRLIHEGVLEEADDAGVVVQVSLADEEDYQHKGTIDFLDNQIDPNAGTQRVRAVIHNGDRLLSPGLFVRLRFPVSRPHEALLVQEEALGTDQGQRFLYVLNDKDEVGYRRVKVGTLTHGRRVIEDGLVAGERIVVNGLQRVRPGDKVTPKPISATAEPRSSVEGLAMDATIARPQTVGKPVTPAADERPAIPRGHER